MIIDRPHFYEPGRPQTNRILVPYSDIMLFAERALFLYIYGWIDYRDVWNEMHQTHFSFFYHFPQSPDRNPQGFYAEPSSYNYET